MCSSHTKCRLKVNNTNEVVNSGYLTIIPKENDMNIQDMVSNIITHITEGANAEIFKYESDADRFRREHSEACERMKAFQVKHEKEMRQHEMRMQQSIIDGQHRLRKHDEQVTAMRKRFKEINDRFDASMERSHERINRL